MTLPIVLVPHPHVRIEANVLGGSPYVAGSRVLVRRLWAFYRDGSTVETLFKRFPQLGPAQLFDALAFAHDNEAVLEADIAREQEMLRRTSQRLPGRPKGSEQIELPFETVRSARRTQAAGRSATRGRRG